MTDTANAPEREAGTPGPHEPDYKTAMLYHSDRADAYMGERDALTAELAKLRADLAEAQAKIALPMLFNRFPNLAFAPGREVKHKIAPAFNGYGEVWLVK